MTSTTVVSDPKEGIRECLKSMLGSSTRALRELSFDDFIVSPQTSPEVGHFSLPLPHPISEGDLKTQFKSKEWNLRKDGWEEKGLSNPDGQKIACRCFRMTRTKQGKQRGNPRLEARVGLVVAEAPLERVAVFVYETQEKSPPIATTTTTVSKEPDNRIKQLQEENKQLRDRIACLERENKRLRSPSLHQQQNDDGELQQASQASSSSSSSKEEDFPTPPPWESEEFWMDFPRALMICLAISSKSSGCSSLQHEEIGGWRPAHSVVHCH